MDQNWFINKIVAQNYRIWTLRFLLFPIFESLSLSPELHGGLLINCSFDWARCSSKIIAQKIVVALPLKTHWRNPENYTKKVWSIFFSLTSTDCFPARFFLLGGWTTYWITAQKLYIVRNNSDIQTFGVNSLVEYQELSTKLWCFLGLNGR